MNKPDELGTTKSPPFLLFNSPSRIYYKKGALGCHFLMTKP